MSQRSTIFQSLFVIMGFMLWIGSALAFAKELRVYARSLTEIVVINPTDDTVVDRIPIPAGPSGIVINPAGTRVYVTTSSGTIAIIDTITNDVLKEAAINNGELAGLAFHPSGTKLYVPQSQTGLVLVLDPDTLGVLRTIPVGSLPQDVKIHPGGTKAYVPRYLSSNVDVIDIVNDQFIKSIFAGDLPWVEFTSDGTRAVVANAGFNCGINGGYTILDSVNDVAVFTTSLGHGTTSVAIDPSNTIAFLGSCSLPEGTLKVDIASGTILWDIRLGHPTGKCHQINSRWDKSIHISQRTEHRHCSYCSH